ncbi:pickpocket protein 28 [Spodoptera litura]|uniref:Pickpocket protein 28 n=1 Tax=Spodoptera litura TaxID=69820 RepID=A0A9J7ITV6_SPOLT|nr:pickpocket protein 28 [Spodoptera litura]
MVPFPSVTLCPQSKCKVSVYNFTKTNIQLDKLNYHYRLNGSILNETMIKEITKFYGISQICDAFDPSYVLEEKYRYTDSSIVEDFLEISPDYEDVFSACKLNGNYTSCTELFDKVVTGEGICYTMNSLAAADILRTEKLQKDYLYLNSSKKIKGWSLEYGYSYENSTDRLNPSTSYYPMPGMPNRASPDVEIVLREYHIRDKLCNAIRSGFKVYIQHPADLPQSSLYYYAVLNSQVSSMALSFSILNSSDRLRSYDAEVRQCYFPDERYLRYFKIYTASNCMIECLSNITYEKCGCVEFYMPHSSSKQICTQLHADCIKMAREIMLHRESSQGDYVCHCLPSCNSVDYDAEILKTDYNLQKLIGTYDAIYKLPDKETLNSYNYSKLEIYFKKPRFLSMRRSELFGIIDFLSNCGGLLGLCLGFSFLSLMEIVYFLTLRLCCTLKKDLEEEKNERMQGKEIHVEKY